MVECLTGLGASIIGEISVDLIKIINDFRVVFKSKLDPFVESFRRIPVVSTFVLDDRLLWSGGLCLKC